MTNIVASDRDGFPENEKGRAVTNVASGMHGMDTVNTINKTVGSQGGGIHIGTLSKTSMDETCLSNLGPSGICSPTNRREQTPGKVMPEMKV